MRVPRRWRWALTPVPAQRLRQCPLLLETVGQWQVQGLQQVEAVGPRGGEGDGRRDCARQGHRNLPTAARSGLVGE